MKINFFNKACQEEICDIKLFGLCDDQNGSKAYTNLNDPTKWIAIVKNNKKLDIVFTAIDKCIIKDNELKGRGRCDGMLTSLEHIYFIELKNQQSNWIEDAISQLESSIEFFISNHDIQKYKHKKAFACNKNHRRFQEIDNERNLKFFRKYGVRIDLQAEIIVL